MANISLFASLTGLHLAVLQFSYFFVLLINVTSTYITYMTIVMAWMTGTLIGLWLQLSAGLCLLLGVASYYTIYLLVISDPLSPTILPISALGVAVTGLWAGRFFVLMLPLFGRSDRLFFHENNGFLLGVIGVFLGFTMLGKPFLLWMPLISVLLLLAHMVALGGLHQHSDRKFIKPDPGGCEESAERVVVRGTAPVEKFLLVFSEASCEFRAFAIVMIALNLLIPTGIVLCGSLIGDNYWVLFRGDDNLITWFSSVQLMFVGVVAYLNRETSVLMRKLNRKGAKKGEWIWWIFMLGFFFLALDEQLRIHELVRDGLLKPDGTLMGLEYLHSGDIDLYFYFVVGLGLTWFLRAELQRNPLSLVFFGVALTLVLSVAVIDSLPEELKHNWPMPDFWTAAYGKIGENLAQLMLLLSFLTVLQDRLKRLVSP